MNKSFQQSRNMPRRHFLRLASGAALGSIALPLFGQSRAPVPLDVYKSETCGCCVNWIEQMQTHGFESTIYHPADLNGVKDELGVRVQWQSCHTAVTAEGFLFEGHVPARYINQFLAAPPTQALGLAVPGMPLGSPGMEVGDQFTPYDIILMKKDGTAEVYASIKSFADQ